ncbi:MAG: ABC transporter permease [Oscillospiraceae bacterium]|nr:ABC transporter permease [Oscillospiraceae bacterium]
MKKTQRTDIIRLVMSRKVDFLTLCLIIALGLGGFFAGQQIARSMKDTAQKLFREQRFWDCQIVSSMGAVEEDVVSVGNLPEVADAEGMISVEGEILLEDSVRKVQIISLTERVSIPMLVSGRLPSAADECALEPDVLEACGGKVGDMLALAPTKDASDFSPGCYLVTGTVYHPDYIRTDTADVIVLDPAAFQGRRFDRIAVIAAGVEEMDPFSDAYTERMQDVRKALNQVTGTLTAGLPASLRDHLRWIVLDRDANAGYVNYTSTAGANAGAGIAFGFLFLLVIALECYSTLAVIVEEEKRVIGVTKAFGFRSTEVLGKYVAYGVGAALLGSLLGMGFSWVVGSSMLRMNARTNLFVINATKPVMLPFMTFAVCAGIVCLCAATAALSCIDLLRSPAELLLKGVVLRRQRRMVTRGSRNRSSLYLRMILRNMSTDFSRVILSVGVVAVSCILIGSGITVKLAHDGANHRQLSDVMIYDIRMSVDENIGEETRKALEDKMNADGVKWSSVRWETRLFDNDGTWDSTLVICGDRLENMIGLANPATGEEQIPGDEGALIQCRMAENLQLASGDTLTMLDSNLQETDCPVSGSAINYSSRMVVMNRTVYDRVFGAGQPDNAYLVLLNGMQDEAFRDGLLSISDDLSFERADSFFEQYKSIAATYNMIVLLISGIAILISFVILINLANIYIARKKQELVILRINGFNVWMCKVYVAYDALVTTIIGLALGVLIGIPVASRAVRIMERDYFQFVRETQPIAWLFAVAVEAFFAMVIYGFAMRKIRHYDIGDLSGMK